MELNRVTGFTAVDSLSQSVRQAFKLVGRRQDLFPNGLSPKTGRCLSGDFLAQPLQFRLADPVLPGQVGIHPGKVGGGDKADSWNRPDMVHVGGESLKSGLRFGGRKLSWSFPLLARGIVPSPKIDAVPKLLMHPFAGMIKDTD